MTAKARGLVRARSLVMNVVGTAAGEDAILEPGASEASCSLLIVNAAMCVDLKSQEWHREIEERLVE